MRIAWLASELVPLLAWAEAQADLGRTLVGYVAYEAAPAFDPALPILRQSEGLPLAVFASFDAPETGAEPSEPGVELSWQGELDREAYEERIRRIRAWIGAGDIYQANFSLRFRTEQRADPLAVFASLSRGDRLPHAAYLDLGRHVFASGSPELFFELDGDLIRSRPMKGTEPRGRFPAEDSQRQEMLSESLKNRAENLMITDMVRNDLGRVARTGSVRADSLFEVERYATVHQMTSSVTARTDASIPDLFRALFPAASITGAPKRRAMEVIAETEASPRGIYTGCIGTIGPGRKARFSVAIRTAWLDRATGVWVYGTGSGIVWDSDPAQEYTECLAKTVSLRPRPEFSLFETILHVPGQPSLSERHFARMLASARYFGFEADEDTLAHLWERHTLDRSEGTARVQLDRDGKVEIRWSERRYWPEPVRIGLAQTPVDSGDPLLFHKTTVRDAYERAAAECPDCDEAILVNQDGFLTEGTRSSLALRIGERLLTPPLEHGLLPGVLRQKLLEEGVLTEAPLRPEDLERAEEVWVLNALRGMGRAVLVPSEDPAPRK